MLTAKDSWIYVSSLVSLKMDALAVASSKLASSIPSPASARPILSASDPYSTIAYFSVLKFPVDFDIFSLFNSKCPLHLMDLGHFS